MVTATARNIGALLRGEQAMAQAQIPPRNLNWSAHGKWAPLAKAGFESYFVGKLRRGESEPFYERLLLNALGAKPGAAFK